MNLYNKILKEYDTDVAAKTAVSKALTSPGISSVIGKNPLGLAQHGNDILKNTEAGIKSGGVGGGISAASDAMSVATGKENMLPNRNKQNSSKGVYDNWEGQQNRLNKRVAGLAPSRQPVEPPSALDTVKDTAADFYNKAKGTVGELGEKAKTMIGPERMQQLQGWKGKMDEYFKNNPNAKRYMALAGGGLLSAYALNAIRKRLFRRRRQED